MVNESGLQSLLRLWNLWQRKENLPHGEKKWKIVFNQMQSIRRWGVEDSIKETGIIEDWRKSVESDNKNASVFCKIELFFRKDPRKRRRSERAVKQLLEESGGRMCGNFLEIPSIGLHAVKAELTVSSVCELLGKIDSSGEVLSNTLPLNMPLFEFPDIMYFRPTGQNLTTMHGESAASVEFPEGSPDLPPVVAILDGVPNQMHDALKNRIDLYDPEDLSSQYPVGGKQHGTAMASLVIHGDVGRDTSPLSRLVYCCPILQYNKDLSKGGGYPEYVPPDVFIEDRVERALRHMLDREGNDPVASGVKIVNFSIGIEDRPFQMTPSPLAALLDWLSWKYQVLFCVSAGNYTGEIDLGITYQEFSGLSEQEQVKHTLAIVTKQMGIRRLISPAESLNAITVGALHTDETEDANEPREQRFDLLPRNTLFSPVSRFGLGFRRSVKPEVLFPGGRQLYEVTEERYINIVEDISKPGQCVAYDSTTRGDLSKVAYTRGTSNATALATRGASEIYEVLSDLQEEHKDQIPDNLLAVLIKALLVHGAKQSDEEKDVLELILKNQGNAGKLKELMSRFFGYGAVDVERVLSCTEQRATVIACEEIDTEHVHEYQFPLPGGLSGQRIWRRMIVTLAWFSPINPRHRNYRMAKLSIAPPHKWGETPLHLPERPSSDYNQVKRGTVQHEILEGRRKIAAYAQGDHLTLRVLCQPDAAETLEDPIPYGLAVTLEVAEDVNIPIYSQIREGIRMQIPVEPSLESQDL